MVQLLADGRDAAVEFLDANVVPGDMVEIRLKTEHGIAWFGGRVRAGSFLTPANRWLIGDTVVRVDGRWSRDIVGVVKHWPRGHIEPERDRPLTARTRLRDGLTIVDKDGDIARYLGGDWFYWDNETPFDTAFVLTQGARIAVVPAIADDVTDAEVVES